MGCEFRKAKDGEEKIVFSLIEKRVDWMNENDIHQWNETDYLNVYPISYYKNNLDKLFVLVDENGKIVCAAILFEHDENRWNEKAEAFYVHNFVSEIGKSGVGTLFMKNVEDFARKQGKQYLRLDSAEDNKKLGKYYEKLGFVACGKCVDGPYKGICRQKKL